MADSRLDARPGKLQSADVRGRREDASYLVRRQGNPMVSIIGVHSYCFVHIPDFVTYFEYILFPQDVHIRYRFAFDNFHFMYSFQFSL